MSTDRVIDKSNIRQEAKELFSKIQTQKQIELKQKESLSNDDLKKAFEDQLRQSENLDVTKTSGGVGNKALFKIDPNELPKIKSKKEFDRLQKEFANTPLQSRRYMELFVMLSKGVRGSNFQPSNDKKKNRLKIVKESRRKNRKHQKGNTQIRSV